jgi:hypothetical protein
MTGAPVDRPHSDEHETVAYLARNWKMLWGRRRGDGTIVAV